MLYAGLATAAVLVIRGMTKRWREREHDAAEVPYGPREPLGRDPRAERAPVSAADACAGIVWILVMLYALTGGADFGAGFWDLVAGGDERGRRPRALLDRAIAPVWEANHVWLIFVLVVMWTAFPPAYSAILSTLFIPFTLAALGIVMRGASFAFRKASTRLGRAAGLRGGVRVLLGADPVLPGRRPGRDRLGARASGQRGRRPRHELGQPGLG